jgi:hypothetical protein
MQIQFARRIIRLSLAFWSHGSMSKVRRWLDKRTNIRMYRDVRYSVRTYKKSIHLYCGIYPLAPRSSQHSLPVRFMIRLRPSFSPPSRQSPHHIPMRSTRQSSFCSLHILLQVYCIFSWKLMRATAAYLEMLMYPSTLSRIGLRVYLYKSHILVSRYRSLFVSHYTMMADTHFECLL